MPYRTSPARQRLVVRLLAAGLAAALLAGPWTAATGADPAAPDLPGRSDRLPQAAERRMAEQALERAGSIIDQRPVRPSARLVPRRDLTLALRDLRVTYDALPAADRQQARALLARPTDGFDDFYGYAKPALAEFTCLDTASVCLHWAPTDPVHAPSAVDTDSNGVPDFVDLTRDELDVVWQRIVTQGGYRAPLPDSPTWGDGPDTGLDVYLADIGEDQLYGYCVPERQRQGYTSSGYCVLDNDYDPEQFGYAQSPQDNLRVTAAHEFFHAVQFAYDYLEDAWLMEGTAAWVEDEVHDHIDDNRQFIPGGPMTHPRVPLDAPGYGNAQHYTAWTWWRFLGERYPATGSSGMPLMVRRVWERADGRDPDRDLHSLQATVGAITAAGGSFTGALAAYGEAKRRPAAVFEEGASYPTVPLLGRYTLAAGARTTQKVATLPHLTSQTYAFVPGARTASTRWRLRIPVDAPDTSRGSHVQVSVVRRDGRRIVRGVRLNARGVGSIVTDFSSSSVLRVELTVTNAGRRYSCGRGTGLVCEGRSLDDGLRTSFRGITFRG